MNYVAVAGVGLTPFCKPGLHKPYRLMAANAISQALVNANIEPHLIQQAFCSYIYGDSTCGQHALYEVMQTGIPIINVNNNCASGSTALYLARQAVMSGEVDCALAFGFEEMQPGALTEQWSNRESPLTRIEQVLAEFAAPQGPVALKAFGQAGRYYMDTYNVSAKLFAQVAEKSRRHAMNNPHALFRMPLCADQVLAEKIIYDNYLTRLMACPPTCGAAAVIVCNEQFAKQHGVNSPIKILAQAMTTDTKDSWKNPINAVGQSMTQQAANKVYDSSGVSPEDIDVIELHDCFTPNEVITYEALQLCPEGEAIKFITEGSNTYGGKCVIGPSGGLMSKGHPIGATGLAQCAELVLQLRGNAGNRQVPKAKLALQHNIGLGGAAVVTLYGQ
ncbi:lipid-transfer protein [Shewanella gaetbuli]|uniref:Lipid-transfer protein n=1 Tax=Shewanella gaetbuli TaxID=220752 RepID=A0A9X2CJB5_9GAMM|nr:lipid-transfer protein [Shewanella gaetbuli]MCL1143972.1 lipid-transfer protein [Shewanella gaetbuli]